MVSNIPLIRMGELEFLLIQGGMGVGISGANLASAVANEGGAGIIAAVGLGIMSDYEGDYTQKNKKALVDEIRKAKSKTNGIIGANIMHVLSDYSSLVQTVIEEKVDMILSGAGLPLDLPKYLPGNSRTKLIPIVSSARAASIICKTWTKKYNHPPDGIIVEGPKAGGHLGYSNEQLSDSEFVEHGLERIVPEVIAATESKIPIIAAGGIFYGSDIRRFNELGAAGVQMATRFVATNECDAPKEFKEAYVNCKKEDIIIIQSPVGMPGRAISNKFLKDVQQGKKIPTNCPYHCLRFCFPEDPNKSPYCIARALGDARNGRFDEEGMGFVFCGSNAELCNEIISVKKLFESLSREYAEYNFR